MYILLFIISYVLGQLKYTGLLETMNALIVNLIIIES